jgi:succinate-semialdehyde dehydrogenase/glutarate-semialdehyde dehydrogenase
MRLTTEEIFGPVIPVIEFDTVDELVVMANDTPYRLAAYFYTSNIALAQRLADELNFGVVGINDPRPVTAEAPFGGIGQSGVGREGGSEGLMEFLDCKLIGTRV